jgi:hypothetical protein
MRSVVAPMLAEVYPEFARQVFRYAVPDSGAHATAT